MINGYLLVSIVHSFGRGKIAYLFLKNLNVGKY